MGKATELSRRRFAGSALSAAALAALPARSMADAKMQKRGNEMTTLTPYLLFDGKCQQAMEFCNSCFGGDLAATKVKDSPAKDFMAAFQQDKIVNARLRKWQAGDLRVGLAAACPNSNSGQHGLSLSEWRNTRGIENSI